MNVGNVGVDVGDDVAGELVNRFPEVFAFASLESGGGHDVSRVVKFSAKGFGDFAGVVGGTGVDDCDFVDERVAIHELALQDDDHFADGGFLVESGDAERNFLTALFLFFAKSFEVGEVGVVVGVGFEPGHGEIVMSEKLRVGRGVLKGGENLGWSLALNGDDFEVFRGPPEDFTIGS